MMFDITLCSAVIVTRKNSAFFPVNRAEGWGEGL